MVAIDFTAGVALLNDEHRLAAPVTSDAPLSANQPAVLPKAPPGFVYGGCVRMQHAASGRHLHSHASAYPERAEHNVVMCFIGESENDWWTVQPASSCSASDPPRGPVPHGAAIRLQHYSSSRYLCSGQAASHVESGEWEVSAAAREDAVGCEQWLAFFSHEHAFVRLQHDTLAAPPEAGRAALFSRAQQHYPAWGHQQQEIAVAAVAAMDAAAPAPASTSTSTTATASAPAPCLTCAWAARHCAASAPAPAGPRVYLCHCGTRPTTPARVGGEWWGVKPRRAVLSKESLPLLSLAAPPGAAPSTRMPHPAVLRLGGAELHGPAAAFCGVYCQVFHWLVNGKPCWRHATRPGCWIAWNGVDAWMAQLETELGGTQGFVELSWRAEVIISPRARPGEEVRLEMAGDVASYIVPAPARPSHGATGLGGARRVRVALCSSSPDRGGGVWSAVGANEAWSEEPGLGCISLGLSLEDAEIAVRCAQAQHLADEVAAMCFDARLSEASSAAVTSLKAMRHSLKPCALCGAAWREWGTLTKPAACQLCGVAVERGDKGLHCGARGHQLCWGCVVLGVPWTSIVRDELSRGQPLRCVYVAHGLLACPCMEPQWEAAEPEPEPEPEAEAEPEAEGEDYWSKVEPPQPPAAAKVVKAADFADRTAATPQSARSPRSPPPPPPPPPEHLHVLKIAPPKIAPPPRGGFAPEDSDLIAAPRAGFAPEDSDLMEAPRPAAAKAVRTADRAAAAVTAMPLPPTERVLNMAASRGFAPDDLDLAREAPPRT